MKRYEVVREIANSCERNQMRDVLFFEVDTAPFPLRDALIDRRAVEDAGPYALMIEPIRGSHGPMHPKGTCSASLHCVGIGPYDGE